MTFLGAAGLAFFALLVHSFVVLKIVAPALHGDTAPHVIPFSQLLPWALPPATVATVFLAMADREPTLARPGAVLVDALAHGSAAAAASIVALFLATVAGSSFQSVPPGMMGYLAPITAGAIGASIGAVLCMTCRRRFGSMRAPAAPTAGAAVTP